MNLREASTQVKSLERLELETVSRPTQTLVRKLLGPDASFEDLEVMTMAVSRESDRLILEDALRTMSESFGDAVSIQARPTSSTSQGQ